MTDNATLAIRLFEQWPGLPSAEVASLFTDDAVYVNVPIPGETIGGAAIVQVLHGAFMAKMRSIEPRIVNSAAQGDLVFVERVERFVPKEGDPFELPVVGVVRVRAGKISEWRDYFDMAQWRS